MLGINQPFRIKAKLINSKYDESTTRNSISENDINTHIQRHLNSHPFLFNTISIPSSSMDDLLCDELLQQIFNRSLRASRASTTSLSLVSKRWLRISRASTTSLSLRLLKPFTPSSLASFLSAHPYLTSLSIITPPDSSFHHPIIVAISSVACPVALTHLRLLTAPISSSSLAYISRVYGSNLVSLSIEVCTNFDLTCLTSFPRLKDLSLSFAGEFGPDCVSVDHDAFESFELPVESLSLSGVGYYEFNMEWLWKSCKRLKVLKLKCCRGLGASFSSLDGCFSGLERVEMRTCRTIVDKVLFKLCEVSRNLDSLFIYDGGSRDGLLHFITNCKSDLRRVDFRLPLDFDDDHLYAFGQSMAGLTSVRLQSCSLVTGQGLKSLAAATCDGLRELSLVSCKAVEREPGLLAALGQILNALKTLDLSYNETLQDKELASMLESCGYLNELKLRGCQGLTNASLVSISRSCKQLKVLDIADCSKMEAEFVERLVLSSPSLQRVVMEEGKVTDVAKSWMWQKSIDHAFA